MPDSQFCLESKTEPEWEKNYIGGDTAQKKCILGGGDTAHTLLMRVTHGVGTPHNIERWEGGRTYFVDGRNNWGGDTAQHRKNKYEVLIRCVLQYIKTKHRRVCFEYI